MSLDVSDSFRLFVSLAQPSFSSSAAVDAEFLRLCKRETMELLSRKWQMHAYAVQCTHITNYVHILNYKFINSFRFFLFREDGRKIATDGVRNTHTDRLIEFTRKWMALASLSNSSSTHNSVYARLETAGARVYVLEFGQTLPIFKFLYSWLLLGRKVFVLNNVGWDWVRRDKSMRFVPSLNFE